MSTHVVERVLWEICNMPEKTATYIENPDAHLANYQLDEDERRMVKELDVKSLAERNVSQMLLMMTWNVLVGAEKVGEYLGRMNAGQNS